MTPAWVGIVAVAVLFAVAGVVGTRGCDGRCPGCGHDCAAHRKEGGDVR